MIVLKATPEKYIAVKTDYSIMIGNNEMKIKSGSRILEVPLKIYGSYFEQYNRGSLLGTENCDKTQIEVD